ncbi:MAG TPA: 50S ribosomal protein L29 [Alphaproteobacteria bacterium]|nr:50S ribosomal protein L29 [Alphaproteobacteria bacterium]
MKQEDLKGKTPDELVKMLTDLRREQMNLRFQKGAGQTENTARVRIVRRTIARVKTYLTAAKTGPDKGKKTTKSSAAPKTPATPTKRGKKAA